MRFSDRSGGDFGVDPISPQLGPISELPDYTRDLNAIHEAEKSLSHQEKRNYAIRLQTTYGDLGALFATAQQRADMFLRVKGLWTEDAD